MKRLFLLIALCTMLFAVGVPAQNKSLTLGDSILVKDNSVKGTYTLVAVLDTAAGSTDTCVVEYYSAYLEDWITVGVMKMTDRTFAASIIPGNGLKGLWLVNYPTPADIRIRRTNITNLTSKTKVSFIHIE